MLRDFVSCIICVAHTAGCRGWGGNRGAVRRNCGVEGPVGNGSGFSPKKFGTKPPPPGPRQKSRPYPPFRGAFFGTLRRDFRRPYSRASRSRFRRAVRRLRSRSENPAGTLQAGTSSSAAKSDFASADAAFVASDHAAVRDRKIPPEFLERESCGKRVNVFSHIKPGGPNRERCISAYSPGRTFQALYHVHCFNRRVESDGLTDFSNSKVLSRLFILSTVSTALTDDGLTDFSSLKVLTRLHM